MEQNLNQFIKICMSLEIYTRMHHWNTTNYALHRATDKFIDILIEIMDKFVEVYIGLYNVRPSFNQIRVDNCCLTDIDDKIINRAKENGKKPKELKNAAHLNIKFTSAVPVAR
jgi:DNA-binding ferritin-like protein